MKESYQPTEIPIAPPVAPKKSNLPLILGGILILLLAVVGSVYAGMKIQEKKLEKVQTPSPDAIVDYKSPTTVPTTSKVEPTQSTDETANWKTYTDSKFGFELKYPSTFTNVQPASGELLDLLFIGPTQKASGRTQTEMFDGMRIRAYVQDANPVNLKTYVEEQRLSSEKSVKDFDGKVSSISQYKVGKTIGYLYDVGGYGNSREVYLPLEDKVLLISLLHAGSNELDLGYLDTFDQILSTFKFLQ